MRGVCVGRVNITSKWVGWGGRSQSECNSIREDMEQHIYFSLLALFSFFHAFVLFVKVKVGKSGSVSKSKILNLTCAFRGRGRAIAKQIHIWGLIYSFFSLTVHANFLVVWLKNWNDDFANNIGVLDHPINWTNQKSGKSWIGGMS